MLTYCWVFKENKSSPHRTLLETQQNYHMSKVKWETEIVFPINQEVRKDIFEIFHNTIEDNAYKWFQLLIFLLNALYKIYLA